MKFPKEYLEEIKQRIKVSDIVGASVQLKRRGREFIGLSPFSKEKSPSFTINDEKGYSGATSIKDMGKAMGILKSKYSGSIDFSKAGTLLKELLSK